MNKTNNKDYCGRKSGLLTAVRPRPDLGKASPGTTAVSWEFICECGKVFIGVPHRVFGKKNARYSCGCIRKKVFVYIGQVFGFLQVIRPDGKDHYRCVCLKCNSIIRVFHYDLIKNSETKKCFDCFLKEKSDNVTEDTLYRQKLALYRHKALLKKRVFDLNFDQFKFLILKNCFYCGEPPATRVFYRGKANVEVLINGVDRKNNKEGYVTTNVVSCCAKCNFIKHELDIKDFCEWINKVNKTFENNIAYDPQPIVYNNKSVYSIYRHGAQKRNMQFNLTLLEFNKLINQLCVYCGAPPLNCLKSGKRIDLYNGVDRINSKIGYVIDNVVTCCRVCNRAKNDFSVDLFKKQVNLIFNHLYKKVAGRSPELKAEILRELAIISGQAQAVDVVVVDG